MKLLMDILLDTVLDGVRMVPFLFAAFLLLEALEHHSTALVQNVLTKIRLRESGMMK